MAKDGKFPVKDNFGVTSADIARGFTPGSAETEDHLEGEEYPGANPEKALVGFCGRAKGWER